VKYGTLPEHYPMVGRTLLKTFESFLKKDWTPEVKQAWVDAYEAITSLMLEGASYSEEILRLCMEDP
jgi:nitric oxide dioxygenase